MDNPSTLLVVKDLKESLEFYTVVMALTLVEHHHDCVKLQAGEHIIIMFEGTYRAEDYSHGYHANSTLLFTVEDLDKSIERLKSQGVDFVHQSPNQNQFDILF